MINYTIDKAISCKKINKIIVTSDSKRILNKSRDHKKIIKMLRPKELATNSSQIDSTIDYTLKKLKSDANIVPNIVLLLEPTSPLRQLKTINKAIKILNKAKVNSIIPVTKSKYIFGTVKKIFLSLLKIFLLTDKRESTIIWSTVLYGDVNINIFIKIKKFYQEILTQYWLIFQKI